MSTLSALPDILCLQETFLRQNPFISDYQLIRKDRAILLGKGGGVSMFIKTITQFNQLTEFDNLKKENKEIGISVIKITLINLYNSPTTHLSKDLLDLISSYKNVILVGDFNAHHPLWDQHLKTLTEQL